MFTVEILLICHGLLCLLYYIILYFIFKPDFVKIFYYRIIYNFGFRVISFKKLSLLTRDLQFERRLGLRFPVFLIGLQLYLVYPNQGNLQSLQMLHRLNQPLHQVMQRGEYSTTNISYSPADLKKI